MALEVVRIDENTWRIEDGMVRMFLLKGKDKALLIDSGVSGSDVRTLSESLVDVPVELLNTHGDRDHIAANHLFSKFYIHPEDMIGCGMADKFPDSEIIPIHDGDVIDLGERTLQVIHMSGHTKGSVAIVDKHNRVLYSGDSVQDGHIYMFGAHRVPEEFEKALNKLISYGDSYDLIYPSHGTPVLSNDYVEKVAMVWDMVCSGKLTAYPKQVHGKEILCVDHQFCGFFCDKN